jgi:2-(1,2-epoxy-1,2-dihydrophenyl)acetyl-CoA isomerase
LKGAHPNGGHAEQEAIVTYETLNVVVDDGVATVTLDRPDRRNGITGAMVVELYAVVQDLERRPDVRVVVLTGAGNRFFCPGADLDLTQQNADAPPADMPDPRVLHISAILHDMPAVTVAAINGSCAGAGLGWAAACDLRVAASHAMFATAFLDIGVAGDMGLPWSLSRIVGGAKARELFFLRGKFDAAEALRIGLVSDVIASAEFAGGVARLVARLRDAAPRALRTMKANFVAAERMSFVDFLDLETERHLQLVTGAEFRAGVDAFIKERST